MLFFLKFRKQLFSFFLFSLLAFGAFSIHAQENADDDDSGEAVALFNKGQDAHEKGDFETAIKFYDEALKIIPEFPEAEYQKGTAFLSLKKNDDAEKSFRRAVELREDWTLPMAQLGSLLVGKNQFAEAEKLLIKATETDEQNFLAYSALTELRLKSNSSPEVLQTLLTKIQSLTSKTGATASVWSARAALENKLGDKKSAKQSVNRSLAIEPNNISALNEKVEIALSENDFKGALENARNLVKLNPDSVSSKIILARAYISNENLSEATKILDSLDQNNPNVAEIKRKLTTNETENVAELEKLLTENPKDASVLARLCNLTRIENPQKSLDYCRRASDLEPNNINHAIGYGAALVQARNFDQAVSLFRRLLQIAPDNYTAHVNLAASLFQLKRYNEAIVEYNWISEKQPELAVTYYFLGIAHDSLKEYIDAMANYQQFLKLAKPETNQLEIDKVNLRLPGLQRLLEQDKKNKRRKQ